MTLPNARCRTRHFASLPALRRVLRAPVPGMRDTRPLWSRLTCLPGSQLRSRGPAQKPSKDVVRLGTPGEVPHSLWKFGTHECCWPVGRAVADTEIRMVDEHVPQV